MRNNYVYIFCLAIVLNWISLCLAIGQSVKPPTQYRKIPIVVSPSEVGNHEMIDVNLLFRSQYMGYKGAPTSWFLSGDLPIEILGTKHGGGLIFKTETIGNYVKVEGNLIYSYKHKIDSEKQLSGGIGLGFISYGLTDVGQWGNLNDPAIPTQKEQSSGNFDLSLGIDYQMPNLKVGVGMLHVTYPRILKVDNQSFIPMNIFVYAESPLNLDVERKLIVTPSLLVDFTSFRRPVFLIAGEVSYANRFWGAFSYRIEEALGLQLGMRLFGRCNIGLMYEYPISKLAGLTGGTLELLVSYSFESFWKKQKKNFKSLRYL